MRLICKQIRQDVATANGRVYSREALDRVAALSNQQSVDGRCLLAADVPPGSTKIALADVAGRVDQAFVIDGQLVVEVVLLDTPKGAPFRLLAPGLVERTFSVVPLLFGTTSNGMNIDPYSIAFNGWALTQ